MENQKSYEVKLRILGNEVFAISLSSSSDSNRWVAIGLVTVFSVLTVLGAYGDQLVTLYHNLIK
jgi:hypothetical protein